MKSGFCVVEATRKALFQGVQLSPAVGTEFLHKVSHLVTLLKKHQLKIVFNNFLPCAEQY